MGIKKKNQKIILIVFVMAFVFFLCFCACTIATVLGFSFAPTQGIRYEVLQTMTAKCNNKYLTVIKLNSKVYTYQSPSSLYIDPCLTKNTDLTKKIIMDEDLKNNYVEEEVDGATFQSVAHCYFTDKNSVYQKDNLEARLKRLEITPEQLEVSLLPKCESKP